MTNTEPAAPNKRRGCFAFGCLVPLALVVVLSIGGFFAGRAYVRSHIDEWRDDSAIVDLAVTVFGLEANETTPLPPGPVGGESDPAKLPADIVIYPQLAPPTVHITDTVTVFEEVSQSSQTVIETLADSLAGAGWDLVSDTETPGGRAQAWSSDTRLCVYEVVDGFSALTEVWIRCRPAS